MSCGRVTCPVFSRYVSVSCKLLSVISCRHGLPGSLEKAVSIFFDLSGKLYVSVCLLRGCWNASISSCRTAVNVSST